ncbi:unnamed protein product [Eruca vesicaria subsp. sativa]|uniref:Prolamin-like domain-containing protein n=1 Tax=Eruca vesicaria subsp. sativa TaxID=29727 RepID=A0ABC8LXZ2_ERUVS|nr:unnamed protein product [Eruca vesicaria subsp. sativa]
MGSKVFFSVILTASFLAENFVTQGVAQVQQPATIPGLFPPGLPIDLVKCWSSLFNIEGCVLQISNSILSDKFENLEATCCKAFSSLDANCWSQMFPLNPLFPPILKENCARIVPNPPTHK